jgi:hypothetical protein
VNRRYSLKRSTLAWVSLLVVTSCGKADEGASPNPDAPSAGAGRLEVPLPGVRPDVEEFIAVSFGDSPDKRQVARQYALPLQTMSESGITASQAQSEMDRLMKATGCLDAVMGDDADAVSVEMTARVVNTKDRLLAYLSVGKHLSGGAYNYPEPPSAGCSFERMQVSP